MELLIIFIVIVAIIAGFVAFFERLNKSKTSGQPWSSPARTNSSVPFRQSPQQLYFYSRKDDIMTSAEWRFFGRLNVIAADKYYVFPQIHLSSLLRNETKGKYFKLAFQRINRRSVDFVLCDIETHKPIYAVELDDWSHDSAKRQARIWQELQKL